MRIYVYNDNVCDVQCGCLCFSIPVYSDVCGVEGLGVYLRVWCKCAHVFLCMLVFRRRSLKNEHAKKKRVSNGVGNGVGNGVVHRPP